MNDREFDNYPEGEIDEMIELYENRGISKEDVRQNIFLHLCKY